MPASLPRVRAPEFGAGQWLKTPQPVRMGDLRGRPVLVDIWDYTCVNCLRTLPYLTAWHRAYGPLGTAFVGVHTPEFAFAREARQVSAALERYGIEYPVLLDNEQHTWLAFANRYWPTVYLIDAQGVIRYQHSGEGGYGEIERALAELVLEAGAPAASLPRPLAPLRPEDAPGAVCFRPTPELHAGYDRGSLGNPEGYFPRSLPGLYRLPQAFQRHEGYYYVEGAWQAGRDHLALAGASGALHLPYRGATANAVLAASADAVDLMLGLKPPVDVVVTQDGAPLDSLSAGADISFTDGQSLLRVSEPRMYEIARSLDDQRRDLRLEASAPGLAVFSFTFSSCVLAAAW